MFFTIQLSDLLFGWNYSGGCWLFDRGGGEGFEFWEIDVDVLDFFFLDESEKLGEGFLLFFEC